MPKIDAGSIAEHVTRQEQRVFAAAIGLFIERGYSNVSYADIADAVGLARNSLYRYFPNKADILAQWFHQELDRRFERSVQILARVDPPLDLIVAWVDDQLDYAAQPEHALMVSLGQNEPEPAAQIRSEVFGTRSRLMAPLRPVLVGAGVAEGALDATAALFSGLILGAARFEADHGAPDPMIRDRLRRAIQVLLS
ncbi:MAG TPA: TetR/AcrR family transcriptional regulator [Acidimicrobiales bacterium]|nr:TetR/AcrR family transcriptional regulator [Acidimicrobiales bacterium]